MNEETLEGYNRYIAETFATEDDDLRAAREEMKRGGCRRSLSPPAKASCCTSWR